MDNFGVRRLALVLTIQAEIEGMKIDNKVRAANAEAPAYSGREFIIKAENLRELAYKHNEQI